MGNDPRDAKCDPKPIDDLNTLLQDNVFDNYYEPNFFYPDYHLTTDHYLFSDHHVPTDNHVLSNSHFLLDHHVPPNSQMSRNNHVLSDYHIQSEDKMYPDVQISNQQSVPMWHSNSDFYGTPPKDGRFFLFSPKPTYPSYHKEQTEEDKNRPMIVGAYSQSEYREKRIKNNEAARKSREKKRQKNKIIYIRHKWLMEQFNGLRRIWKKMQEQSFLLSKQISAGSVMFGNYDCAPQYYQIILNSEKENLEYSVYMQKVSPQKTCPDKGSKEETNVEQDHFPELLSLYYDDMYH